MRALLFLCALALVGAGARADCGPECDPLDPELVKHLDEQEHRLDELTAEVENVAHELDKLHDDREHAETDSFNMIQQLERLTGDHHCGHHKFACGGHENECIHHLEVCDGHKDCHSEHDEDDRICKPDYIHAGDSWSGHFVFYNCSNHIYDELKFTLNKFEPRKDMLAEADVEGELYWEDISHPGVTDVGVLPYKGHYSFSRMTADFIVNYGGRVLDEKLYFLPGHEEVMHYDIYVSHGGKLCGRAYLLHDDHHDDDHNDDDHH